MNTFTLLKDCNFLNQAIGYASQHILCLSQARINWEGYARKGIQRENGGVAEMEAPVSLDGWQSIRIVGASACVIFILHQKIQKTSKCTFWYQLTQIVLDKVQRAVKWLCGVVCVRNFFQGRRAGEGAFPLPR